MPRNFKWSSLTSGVDHRSPRFWLQAAVGMLAAANIFALFLYVFPPGGNSSDLMEENEQVRRQIDVTRGSAARLRNVAGKVQAGSVESVDFEKRFFLPKRTAYDTVISEIQRISKASGVQEKEAVFSEEPIEGSVDLSLLNVTSSYEGTYDNLMHFLYEADKSPMLLMLDTLQAAPQQRGAQINTSIRFQVVVREDVGGPMGGQP